MRFDFLKQIAFLLSDWHTYLREHCSQRFKQLMSIINSHDLDDLGGIANKKTNDMSSELLFELKC